MNDAVLQNVPVTYSDHAKARMTDRAVFKKQVRRTLRRPEKCYARGQEQVVEYTTSAGSVVRVVYLLTPGASECSFYIVTVIRLGKLKGAFQRGAIETVHDRSCDLAYVGLLHGRMAETVEAGEGIYYDVDHHGEILGVEISNYSRYQTGGGDAMSVLERLPVPLPASTKRLR